MIEEIKTEEVVKDKRGRKKGELIGAKYNVVPKKAVSAYLPEIIALKLKERSHILKCTRSHLVNDYIKNWVSSEPNITSSEIADERTISVSVNLHEVCYDIISDLSEELDIPFSAVLRKIITGSILMGEDHRNPLPA